MSHHTAHVSWQRQPQEAFTDNRYSRRHRLRFDGGADWLGAASPDVVRVPLTDPAGVDPEEAFVASLSACHMLWFLNLAAEDGWCIERYDDEAVGTMARNAEGRLAITTVTLRPRVAFAGERLPSEAQAQALHHRAHEACFIAASVRTELRCEPAPPARA
jgi:organic hydroperoxide reductase OsmC/OhrA